MSEHAAAEAFLLDIVGRAQRSLLRADRPRDVRDALFRLVGDLGGRVVPADAPGPDVIPLDLTLGDRDPVVAAAEPGSLARSHLDRVLADIVEDAHRVVGLLRAAEDVQDSGETDLLTGALTASSLERLLDRCGAGDALVGFGFAERDGLVSRVGRAHADALLGELASLVRRAIHPADRVGRLGPGALAVVLLRGGEVEAQRLVAAVEAGWGRRSAAATRLSSAVLVVDSPEAGTPRALADLRAALEGGRQAGGRGG